MESRDPSNNHHSPAAQHHLNPQQQPPPLLSQPYPSSSFSYFPNPNPSPNPTHAFDNPLPSSSSAATASDVLQTPGVDSYLRDPYATHLAYDGVHSIASQSYAQIPADYYYQQQYASNSFSYGVAGTGNTTADLESKKLKVIAGGAPPSSVRVCSICNVVCNSDTVFARHLAGEKHALKAFGISSCALKPKVLAQKKAVTGNTIADLESKKLKVIAGGAPPGSVRVCSICNVVCNSDTVFAHHLAGEKHALKAFGISSSEVKPKVSSHKNALHFTKKATLTAPRLTPTTLPSLVPFVQSSYCDVCKIDCNSHEVLNNHKLGRKHIKNLQKLQESTKPKPASDPKSTPIVNPNDSESKAVNEQPKQNPGPAGKEDLEIKKQKVLSGGAAADAVRVCTHCNVVCNSEAVYSFHISGKKHIAMTNKPKQPAPIS